VVLVTAPLLAATVAALVLASLGSGPHRLPASEPGRAGPAEPWPARITSWAATAVPGAYSRQRDRQLPDAVDRLASALRAGESVGPALVALSRDVPAPLRDELRVVARAIDRGAPVAGALAAWAGTPDASRDVQLVAAALGIGARAGGEVARAVDGVAATLRERHELRGELRALATQARASAAVLAAAPVGFALLVAGIEPATVGFLVTTPVGLGCLLLGIGLDCVGVLWMARITRRVG